MNNWIEPFEIEDDVADWQQIRSLDNDFLFKIPRGWEVEVNNDRDTSLLAYTGREHESVYIVQRVDYSLIVSETQYSSKRIPESVIKEILKARIDNFIKIHSGNLTGKRFTTLLGNYSIEFVAKSFSTTMVGAIFWLNNKTYTLIEILNSKVPSNFSYFKSSFKLIK